MKTAVWLPRVLIVVSHCALFAGGYLLASERAREDVGERALNSFTDGLAALSYLEKGNVDEARSVLRISLDGQLLTMFRYGTRKFDAYNVNSGRDPKSKYLNTYDEIRKRYPPIEYDDGGWMNQHIDDILKFARPPAERR